MEPISTHGRQLEKVDEEKPPAGSPESSATAPEEIQNPVPSATEEEGTPEGTVEEEALREIVLPGTEGEKVAEEPEEEPGIPAAQGAGKSRAGETVDSTEKIQSGQAVDFPWDM